jgi:hypothetical protein
MWVVVSKDTMYGEVIPTGIRNENGLVCHFNDVTHWDGQDKRYHDECAERRKYAEIMCDALNAGSEHRVIISSTEYLQLQKDAAMLNALEAGGVDNWEGYSEACASLDEDEDEDEDEE